MPTPPTKTVLDTDKPAARPATRSDAGSIVCPNCGHVIKKK